MLERFIGGAGKTLRSYSPNSVNSMDNETIRHLELIQGVINRMAQVSFILKGWTVTLVVALFAVVVNSTDWRYVLFGLVPICVFWGLDAYYLRQERLFRCLYDAVRLSETESTIPFFSMDTSIVKSKVINWWKTLFSGTLVGLYATLLVITIIAAIVMS